MRDKRFIAVHRGGPLTKELHCQLIQWAIDCAEHVLNFCGENIDERLIHALRIAKAWKEGKATVGDARKASVGAIAVANEALHPVWVAVARCVGHVVATAHMADHSPGSADYALKAVKLSGKSVELERKWQDEQLPLEIKELVLSARAMRYLKI